MKIVLWRLGSLEHHIYPSKAGIENFIRTLEQTLTTDVCHLVWGPDIDVKVIDVSELNFNKENFDIRALLTQNQVHIVESFKKAQ